MSRLSPSRRSALLALGTTIALALVAPPVVHKAAAQGSPAAALATAHLIVGDVAAGNLYVYDAPEFSLVATFDDLAVGAHTGTLALADGRVLIPDDRNKQLASPRPPSPWCRTSARGGRSSPRT